MVHNEKWCIGATALIIVESVSFYIFSRMAWNNASTWSFHWEKRPAEFSIERNVFRSISNNWNNYNFDFIIDS